MTHGMTRKEIRVPVVAKHGLASNKPSRAEPRATKSPPHKRPSAAPELCHDQQSSSGDVAQGRDEPSNRHQPETFGFPEARRATPVVDPGEGPSEAAHSGVENGTDISQITNKADERQNARQDHTGDMNVEAALPQLPSIPQQTSCQGQLPRAHVNTPCRPLTPLAELKGKHEPHEPQGPLSTIVDDLSSSTSSGSSSLAQKPATSGPAPAPHKLQTPRPSQDAGVGSFEYEALSSERHSSGNESDEITFVMASTQQRTPPLPGPDSNATLLSPTAPLAPPIPHAYSSSTTNPCRASNKARNRPQRRIETAESGTGSEERLPDQESSQELFVETCEGFQRRLDEGTEAWRELERRVRMGSRAVFTEEEDDKEGGGGDGAKTSAVRV